MNTEVTEWCLIDGQLMDNELIALPPGLKTVL